MSKNLSRRDFLKGAAVGAVGVAAMGLTGCGTSAPTQAPKAGAKSDYAANVTETIDCDVLVMGSGSSGISATVQAAELGLNTVCIEINGFVGGNGVGTEGMFAVDSFMQKKQGIHVTFKEIIAKELDIFNYRIDALLWKDMVNNSADNLQWLVDNGVKFSGVVDNYYGAGKVPAFHWFTDGAGSNFIQPMADKAKQLGAKILTNTRGKELIMKDGKVAGMYAVKEDKSTLQINAKAVILCGGGYANNKEMMLERGYDLTHSHNNGIPGHFGDGLTMAAAVGVEDVSRERCFLREPYTEGLDFFSKMYLALNNAGSYLYVNQDAERFTSEAAGSFTKGCNSNAVHTQEKAYFLFDSAWLQDRAATQGVSDLVKQVDQSIASSTYGNVFKADTVKELAEKASLDSDTLTATLDRYNKLCDKRDDEDFGKDASYMIPLRTAPYYLFKMDLAFWTSIGGVRTNRKMEAVTPKGTPVPGLYAAGTEGCELYRDTYTMNVPASCNGNNVNSGRTAARNAYTYIKA